MVAVTVTSRSLAVDSLTVNEAVPPSAALASSMLSVASSSSVIVPVASRVVASPAKPALAGEDSRSFTVSLLSSMVSPLTVTSTVLLVSPAAKLSVPASIAA